MGKNELSTINLKALNLNTNELRPSNSSEPSQFWLANSILNSLYSINNNPGARIASSLYYKGTVFEDIRVQFDIIINNLELVKLNQRENTVKSQIWNELGNCVSVYIIELIEKWDAKICELQSSHLNNCEVTFDSLVPDFMEFKNRTSDPIVTKNLKKKDNLWDNDKIFWEIDSSYPFREFEFGIKEDDCENGMVYSNHITLIYLNNTMKPYLSIWKNIRLFLNNIVGTIFLSGDIDKSNVELCKSELNIYILDLLFKCVEKSLLLLDNNMTSLWLSLLRRCIDSFIDIIPRNIDLNSLSLFNASYYGATFKGNLSEYNEFLRILNDISSNCGDRRIERIKVKDDKYKVGSIGEILEIKKNNDISKSDEYVSGIKYKNYFVNTPIDLQTDVDIGKKISFYPLKMLYTSNNSILLKYTYFTIFGRKIKDKKNELKNFYKTLFIKNSHEMEMKCELGQINGVYRMRVIDILKCLHDFVMLKDTYTEQLFRALQLDSKKVHPNIDVDPTEVNLSIKLLGKGESASQACNNDLNNSKQDYNIIRKVMSMLVLEFDMGISKEHIKEQLPTYHSLKIKLNIPSEGSVCYNNSIKINYKTNLNTYGVPNYIISEFLSEKVLNKYSSVFTFLLEVKRSAIFLDQVFQTLLCIKRERNKLLLCKQEELEKSVEHFTYYINSVDFCDGNCILLLDWVDKIYIKCYKIRYLIQSVIDTYNSYISMHVPIIWKRFESELEEENSLVCMLNQYETYINRLHQLILLGPGKEESYCGSIQNIFGTVQISIVLILKLARNLNLVVYKYNQLIRFLTDANNVMKKRRYIPCRLIRKKIHYVCKRILTYLDLILSNYNEYSRELVESIERSNNSYGCLDFVLLQLKGSIYSSL